MIFKTTSGVEYQMDVEDALRFVGVSITMRTNGYLGVLSLNWTGDTYIHREIMQAGPEDVVDHINGDKLDMRRCNLRICTYHENSCNARLRSDNKTGVRGVYWDKRKLKWSVQISAKRKRICLGYFIDFNEACEVRFAAERKYHGKHAAIDGVLSRSSS